MKSLKRIFSIILSIIAILLFFPINQVMAVGDLTIEYAPDVFNYPKSIVMAGDGGIYVCDTNYHRIIKYTAEGVIDTSFVSDGILGGVKGPGLDQLDSPKDICVDSSGNLYVADSSNKRIIKFTSAGVRDTNFSEDGIVDDFTGNVWGIALDGNNNVYVCDIDSSNNNKITKFNATTGAKDDSFSIVIIDNIPDDNKTNRPHRLVCDEDDYLYVSVGSTSESGPNMGIRKYNSTTGVLEQTIENVGLNEPYAIYVDSSKRIYVADSVNSRIVRFLENGTLDTTFNGNGILGGDQGSAPEQFSRPYGLAVDETNQYLYIADSSNHRIKKYNLTDLSLDNNFDNDGIVGGLYGTESNQMVNPVDIAPCLDGGYIVSESSNERIKKYTSTGILDVSFDNNGILGVPDDTTIFKYPENVVADDDGYIYIADKGNKRIKKYDSTGTLTTAFGGDGCLTHADIQGPAGLAVDNLGNIYVGDTNTDKVLKFNSAGSLLNSIDVTDDPYSIVLDIDGTSIYVAVTGSSGTDHVKKFDASGNLVLAFSGDGILEDGFENPRGVTVDEKGYVYVSDASLDVIKRYDATGTLDNSFDNGGTYYRSKGDGNDFLDYPTGMMVMNNKLYVTDKSNDRIVILRLADVTPPIISNLTPADNSSDIAANTDLVITFDENVVVGTGSITIKKVLDNSIEEIIDVTSGQVAGTGTDTITIYPSVTLEYSTEYYVEIDGTAFDDESGNSFDGINDSTTWNFTIYTPVPEINIKGNGVNIADGDTTPSTSDYTSFGNANITTGKILKNFVIENTGSADLNLTSIPVVSISGTHASDFTVITQPTSPVSAEGSALFTIQFDPSEAGERLATVSIDNNDSDENPYSFTIKGKGVPEISIDDAIITEGNSGIVTADFTVSLSEASGETITVIYETEDNTAVAGNDYVTKSETLTFNAGETSKTVSITINGDLIDEDNETLYVNLSSVVNATVSDSQGVCTITDDDTSNISINDVTITEGDLGTATALLNVSLSNPSSKVIKVNYETSDSTATAGSDYVFESDTLTFNAGETSKTISIIINGDLIDEDNETFYINLSNAVNSIIGDSQGGCMITDDDNAVSISINDVTITEGDLGTSIALFNVALSSESGKTVTVNYATADNTATSGSDYVFKSNTLIFNAGETSKTINIIVDGDSIDEDNETFYVNLSDVANGIISDSQGVCAITDDDVAGFTITESEGNTEVLESGTTDTFTVVLDAKPYSDVALSVASGDTGEVTVENVLLIFTPTDWNVPQTITVTGIDDTIIDGDISTNITISVNDAISDDNFDPVSDKTVNVVTVDNDLSEINVIGNCNDIADGDTTPSVANDTEFGTVRTIGETSLRTFTIENTGIVDLILSGSPKVSISGVNASDFSVLNQPISPIASNGGQTTFTVEFDPVTSGLKTAEISIINNDKDENSYTFTIQGTGVVDNQVPSVIKYSPENGVSNVSLNTNLILTFDEDILAQNGNVFIKKMNDDTIVETFDIATSSSLHVSGNIITIEPTEDFDTNTTYYVEIENTVLKDVAGNAFSGINNKTTWSFTTIKNDNANLSSLTVSEGTLSPDFASDKIEYTVSVGNEISSITLAPTALDSNTTIKVNDIVVTNSQSSEELSLNVGSNIITIVVIAENGTTTKTYTVDVTRVASANAQLSNLEISNGTLKPNFNSIETSYKTIVGTRISSITVTPTASHSNATIKVNDIAVTSGQSSEELNLKLGSNTIKIVVTAEDGLTTKTYTLKVTRYIPKPPNPDPESSETTVTINGKPEKVGTENVQEKDDMKNVEITINEEVLEQKINDNLEEKDNSVEENNIVEITVGTTDANLIKTVLSGDSIKKMEENEFKLAIMTEGVEYIIPAKEIDVKNAAEALNADKDSLKSIEVEVVIEKLDENLIKEITEMADANDFEIIFPPVDFKVIAKTVSETGEEKKVTISKFNNYIERILEIPEDVDPSKITTGIIYNEDGTFSHIPTEVFQKDGKYYAKLNSLTNSSYSVIWNPINVESVTNHWSKDTVNDMASRLIVENPESFEPDAKITRSEFAEYIVKALGIYRTGVAKEGVFTDIKITDEFADGITIAVEYGIINGYPDKSFRPNQTILREEAMVMFARAMKVAKVVGTNTERINNYVDYSNVSEWAKEDIKDVIAAKVFNGTTATTLSPKSLFTHAEAVQAIKNLLVEAKLIND